jgi:hypothetical protein
VTFKEKLGEGNTVHADVRKVEEGRAFPAAYIFRMKDEHGDSS